MPNGLSIGGAAFTLSNEGWSDVRCTNCIGTPFTDAVAGNNPAIDAPDVITVGPGLTNAAYSQIQAGTKFTADEIINMWQQLEKDKVNYVLKANPKLSSLSQNIFDMAIDCLHSGQKWWTDAGWPNVSNAEEAAAACLKMPVKAQGKINAALQSRRQLEAAICKGGRCDGDNNETFKSNAYYKTDSKWVNILKKYFGANAGDANTADSSVDTGTPSTTQSRSTEEAPPPPPVDQGRIWEDNMKNSNSNILGPTELPKDTKFVKHTKIYCFESSTIVLNEMSMSLDLEPDKKTPIPGIDRTIAGLTDGTSVSSINPDAPLEANIDYEEEFEDWLNDYIIDYDEFASEFFDEEDEWGDIANDFDDTNNMA